MLARMLRVLMACWLVFYGASVAAALYADDLSSEQQFAVAFYGAVPLFITWIMLTGASVALGITLIRERVWLRVAWTLALPFLVYFLTIHTIWYLRGIVDVAHFQAVRPQYDAQIRRLRNDGHRFAEFNWGGMLFASRGVTYDETGQLALPPNRQSPAFKARMKNTDLYCGGDAPIGAVRPLGDHYYLTLFGC
jgi:hypothetical protein